MKKIIVLNLLSLFLINNSFAAEKFYPLTDKRRKELLDDLGCVTEEQKKRWKIILNIYEQKTKNDGNNVGIAFLTTKTTGNQLMTIGGYYLASFFSQIPKKTEIKTIPAAPKKKEKTVEKSITAAAAAADNDETDNDETDDDETSCFLKPETSFNELKFIFGKRPSERIRNSDGKIVIAPSSRQVRIRERDSIRCLIKQLSHYTEDSPEAAIIQQGINELTKIYAKQYPRHIRKIINHGTGIDVEILMD